MGFYRGEKARRLGAHCELERAGASTGAIVWWDQVVGRCWLWEAG